MSGVELFGFDEFEQQLKAGQEVDDAEAWVGTAVFYGAFLEFGTALLEPRPWLRPSINEVQQVYFKRLVKALTSWDMEAFEAAPLEIAMEIERRIKANMGGQDSPAPEGDYPAVVTGNLRASIASGETARDMLTESGSNAKDSDTVAGSF